MNEKSFSGFLGIDVSKDKFDAYCIDITGGKHFYLSCPMDRTGFEKLVSRLGALSIPQESLLIGMESTACYHMNPFSFLLAGGYTAVIINPLLISNLVKMQLRMDHSMGRNSAKTTQAIIQAARSSVGTTSPSRELILKQKADVLIHLEGHLKELTALMIELCRSDMGDDIDIMTSLRGIGEKTATNFLVEMGGDIRKFKDHKKLIALAGIDPAIYQSGKHDGHGRITKRGNRHLRRVIWFMTIRVIQFNDCFRNYYKKRTQDGLPFKKAVLATAHKLLRVIYAMFTQRTSFNYAANS